MNIVIDNNYSYFQDCNIPDFVLSRCSKNVPIFKISYPKECTKCKSKEIKYTSKTEFFCKQCKKTYSRIKREYESVSLINFNKYIPTGLMGGILSELKQNGLSYNLYDNRIKYNEEPFPIKQNIQVRQQVEDSPDVFIKNQRGILQLATAVGKTRVAADIIQKLGLTTLYIVPNKGLLTQTKKELEEFLNIDIGIYGGGEKDIKKTKNGYVLPTCLIITVQSLWSILKTDNELFESIVEHTKFLIIDESHHVRYRKAKDDSNPWNTWYITCMKFKNAYYRLGLTATPYEKNDLGRMMLEAVTGKVQYAYDRLQAQEDKVVVPFEVWVYHVLCKENKTWIKAYKQGIVENEEHNDGIIQAEKELREMGRKTVIIFDQKEKHLFEVAKLIPTAESLTGNDGIKVRDDVKEKFINGEIQTILSTVITEGVNIPEIDALIIACGKGSEKTVMVRIPQMVGRGSRLADNKSNLIVVDFIHEGNEMLYKHSMNRIEAYKKLGGVIIDKGRVWNNSKLI